MDNEDSLLDKTLKLLFEQAFKDKVVTDDEFEIIEQVEISIEKYSNALNKALEDGVITDGERKQLDHLKQQILTSAREVASSDGIIDEEEKELLTKLSEVISTYFVD